MTSWFNTKFSWVICHKIYTNKERELKIRSWDSRRKGKLGHSANASQLWYLYMRKGCVREKMSGASASARKNNPSQEAWVNWSRFKHTIALTIPSVDFEMHNHRLTIHDKERNVHTCCLLSPNLSTIAGTTGNGKKYKSTISKKILNPIANRETRLCGQWMRLKEFVSTTRSQLNITILPLGPWSLHFTSQLFLLHIIQICSRHFTTANKVLRCDQ